MPPTFRCFYPVFTNFFFFTHICLRNILLCCLSPFLFVYLASLRSICVPLLAYLWFSLLILDFLFTFLPAVYHHSCQSSTYTLASLSLSLPCFPVCLLASLPNCTHTIQSNLRAYLLYCLSAMYQTFYLLYLDKQSG